jgi:maltokinase
MRPMSERSELDLTLRDVAGMLRSFDYVAGSVNQSAATAAETPETAALDNVDAETLDAETAHSDTGAAVKWAAAARLAFMDGYIERSGFDLHAHRALLDAFEIDKALYEAVYETRNRPDWIAIPVSAIERLANHDPASNRSGVGYV